MLDKIEEKYAALRSAADRLMGLVEAQTQQRDGIAREVKTLGDDIEVLTFSSAALEQLLKAVSVESLETVEALVTYGLRTVFDDQALQFRIDVSTKFKQQWMEPRLVNGKVDQPILDAFGGGPAEVSAFLLRVLVCRRLGLAPFLVLDEPFSMVSSEYQENTAKLLRELADKLGFTIVMVTHDYGYLEYANRGYTAVQTSDGTTLKIIAAQASETL